MIQAFDENPLSTTFLCKRHIFHNFYADDATGLPLRGTRSHHTQYHTLGITKECKVSCISMLYTISSNIYVSPPQTTVHKYFRNPVKRQIDITISNTLYVFYSNTYFYIECCPGFPNRGKISKKSFYINNIVLCVTWVYDLTRSQIFYILASWIWITSQC